MKEVFEFAWK